MNFFTLSHFAYEFGIASASDVLQNCNIYSFCSQTKDNKSLLERLTHLEITYNTEKDKLRSDVDRLKQFEEAAKNSANRMITLQDELARLRKELLQTQTEKKTIEENADTYRKETDKVGSNKNLKS